jgi:hypothetical protein
MDLLERDLGEEFSGREYLLDASGDLEAREPSFFSGIEHAVLVFSSIMVCIANSLNPVR